MKFKITPLLTFDKIRSLVPTAYQHLLPPPSISQFYKLILFRQTKRHAIYAAVVAKALEQLEAEDERVLAVGYCFSLEATGAP